MVYMFIARITMTEGSDVKISFHTSSGRVARNESKIHTCNPFDLKRTPDSTCIAVWFIAAGEVSERRQYDKKEGNSSRWPAKQIDKLEFSKLGGATCTLAHS